MKVSFVVPIYNVEKYLEKCIESILAQTYENIELILVDDGSSDNSGAICDRYQKDKRVKVIHQKNSGVSLARNNGLANCTGDWVCFVDGDDWIANNIVETFLPYLTDQFDIGYIKHKEVKDVSRINEESGRNKENIMLFSRTDLVNFQLAAFNRDQKGTYDFHNVKLSTPCKFYRKKLLDQHNIIFPPNIPTGEDCIFNLYVLRYAVRAVYIDIPMYFHRVWSNSVSQKYNPHVSEDFESFHRELEKYIQEAEKPESFSKAYNERCLWSVGFCCMLDYCHPDNQYSYAERKNMFLQQVRKYQNQINQVELSNFRLKKQIIFWGVKNKMFGLVNALCYLNSKV